MNAGMTPSINALMTVGLVALPGMMTGQLLAGSDPQTAVKYQIIVMLMLVASTAVGTIIVVLWVRRSCFTRAHQLILK
jgi:putative ABC transport system permease protein